MRLEPWGMRHRPMHDALRAFAQDAALCLAEHAATDTDVPFDVVATAPSDRRRQAATLYCYRPRTDEYVRRQIGALGRLPSYPAAVRVLGGLDVAPYLAARADRPAVIGERDRADAALRLFTTAVFTQAESFSFTDEGFDAAYGDLEDLVLAGRSQAEAIVGIAGLTIASDRVALGEGVALVSRELLAREHPEMATNDAATVYARVSMLSTAAGPSAQAAITDRLEALRTALRLFDAPTPAVFSDVALRRASGPWETITLDACASVARGTLTIEASDEEEFRGFVSLVAARTPRHGVLAWALRRYEYGCARADPQEGLTDHLLALRALLEPEGPHTGRLRTRMAALCAPPEERAALVTLVDHAIAVERAAVGGLTPSDRAASHAADEMADHLRALLRDVVLGHLDSDLRAVADRVLAAGPAAPMPA